MDFLTIEDLTAHTKEAFLNQNDPEGRAAIDTIELQNIQLIKSKLNGLYDLDALFDENNKHPLIVRVLTKLVIYDIIQRNSARKVPSDVKDDYKWAMKWLEDVQAGKENPVDLIRATDDEGNTIPNTIFGNTTNNNNYI